MAIDISQFDLPKGNKPVSGVDQFDPPDKMGWGQEQDAWIDYTISAAEKRGLRPDVALSLFKQESGFNANAKSPTGVRGISQTTLATGRKHKPDYNEADRSNPFTSIDVGLDEFAELYKKHGNYPKAVFAYNGGSDPNFEMNVGKHLPWARETLSKRKQATAPIDISQFDPPAPAYDPNAINPETGKTWKQHEDEFVPVGPSPKDRVGAQWELPVEEMLRGEAPASVPQEPRLTYPAPKYSLEQFQQEEKQALLDSLLGKQPMPNPEQARGIRRTLETQQGIKEVQDARGISANIARGKPEYISSRVKEGPTRTSDVGAGPELGIGIARGTLQTLGSMLGTIPEWAGKRFGSERLTETGREIAEYFENKAAQFPQLKQYEGESLWDNPKLLADMTWWASSVGETIPSVAAAFVPGGGAYKALSVGGKALKYSPQVVQRLAALGGAAAGGVSGGALEAAQTYKEVLDRGGSEVDADLAARQMTGAVAILNALPVYKVLAPKGSSKLINYLTTGATESLTEWAEEPTEAIILNEPWGKVIQAAKEGVNIIPAAFLTGAGAAVVGGGEGAAGKKKITVQPLDQARLVGGPGYEAPPVSQSQFINQAMQTLAETPAEAKRFEKAIVQAYARLHPEAGSLTFQEVAARITPEDIAVMRQKVPRAAELIGTLEGRIQQQQAQTEALVAQQEAEAAAQIQPPAVNMAKPAAEPLFTPEQMATITHEELLAMPPEQQKIFQKQLREAAAEEAKKAKEAEAPKKGTLKRVKKEAVKPPTPSPTVPKVEAGASRQIKEKRLVTPEERAEYDLLTEKGRGKRTPEENARVNELSPLISYARDIETGRIGTEKAEKKAATKPVSPLDILIPQYEATGRVAYRYPKKKQVSLDGRTMSETDAIQKMKEVLGLATKPPTPSPTEAPPEVTTTPGVPPERPAEAKLEGVTGEIGGRKRPIAEVGEEAATKPVTVKTEDINAPSSFAPKVSEGGAKAIEGGAKEKPPVNPITLRKTPVQKVKEGTWQVQIVGDINDLTKTRLNDYQKSAGSSSAPTTRTNGDLIELEFNYDTQSAAEGAIKRLQQHPDFTAPAKGKEAKEPVTSRYMTEDTEITRNPFTEKAKVAREKYNRLITPTAHEAGMAEAFPLGAGYGRKGGEQRIEAGVKRATEAQKALKDAEHYERLAQAYEVGKIDERGMPISKDRGKRQAQKAGREERVVAAQKQRIGKEIWEIPADVYADSAGYFAGSGRDLVKYDHEQAVEQALKDNKPVPPEVLAEYPDLKPTPQPRPAAEKGEGEYSPAVKEGLQSWIEDKAYIDNSGNYRLKEGRKIAPWNKEVRAVFPKAEGITDASKTLFPEIVKKQEEAKAARSELLKQKPAPAPKPSDVGEKGKGVEPRLRKVKKEEPAEIAMKFGEHIGGSKFDRAHDILTVDDVKKMSDREAQVLVKKDYIWRRPDYAAMIEAGTPPHVVYLIKRMRDSIPPLPGKYNKEEFVQEVGRVRDTLSNIKTEDEARKAFKQIFPEYIKTKSWTPEDRKVAQMLGGNKFVRALQPSSWEVVRAKRKVEQGWPAVAKSGPRTIRKMPERPILEDIVRTGEDYRQGKNVTPDKFQKTFGFRGGEFGKWLNQADRQASLNHAYDAFMDLANILDIPPNSLSLNGELGFAFGARGGGKHSAHYEPARIVINLTKTRGAGATAHEWAHGLDDYFSRLSGSKTVGDYTSKLAARKFKRVDREGKPVPVNLRPEMVEAWQKVSDAIRSESPNFMKEARRLDVGRQKPYWTEPHEMFARAFETYIESRIEELGRKSQYLVHDTFTFDKGYEESTGYHPYPMGKERENINKTFDNFFKVIEAKPSKFKPGISELGAIGPNLREAFPEAFDEEGSTKGIKYLYGGFPPGPDTVKAFKKVWKLVKDNPYAMDISRQEMSLLSYYAGLPFWISKRYPKFGGFKIQNDREMLRHWANDEMLGDLKEGIAWASKLPREQYQALSTALHDLVGPMGKINPSDAQLKEIGFDEEGIKAVRSAWELMDYIADEDLPNLMREFGAPKAQIDKLRRTMGRIKRFMPHFREGKYFALAKEPKIPEELKKEWDTRKTKAGKPVIYKSERTAQNAADFLNKNADKLNMKAKAVKTEDGWTLEVRKGINKPKVLHYELFDDLLATLTRGRVSIKSRLRTARLLKEYPKMEVVAGEKKRMPEEAFWRVDTVNLEAIANAAVNEVGLPEDVSREQLRDAVLKGIADTFLKRGFGAHFLKRKGTPGYDKTDFMRDTIRFIQAYNGFKTKALAAMEFGKWMGKMDPKADPMLWEYSKKYMKDMLANSTEFDRTVDKVRAGFFFYFLGGVPRQLILQPTQNFIAGVPVLQKYTKWSSAKIAKEMTLAGYDILHDLGVKGIRAATGKELPLSKTKRLDEDTQTALEVLRKRGIISDQLTREWMGYLSGTMGRAGRKIADILSFFIGNAEILNRETFGVVAYRMARKELGMDHLKAMSFTEDLINQVHFRYGKANLPGFARGGEGAKAIRTAYTFRTYPHNLIALYRHLWRTGGEKKGAAELIGPNMIPMVMKKDGSWEPKKPGRGGYLMKALLALFAFGGLTGLPGRKYWEQEIQERTGVNLRSEVAKAAGENKRLGYLVNYGLPGAMGISLAGSIGMDLPTWDTAIKDIIGVPAELVLRPYRSRESMRRGDYLRAMENILPPVAASPISAYRMSTEGLTTKYGKQIKDETGEQVRLGGYAGLMQGLTVKPVELAESFRKYEAQQIAQGPWVERRKNLTAELKIIANRYGTDSKEFDAVQAKMDKFNTDWEAAEDRGISTGVTPFTAKSRRGILRGRETKSKQRLREAFQ